MKIVVIGGNAAGMSFAAKYKRNCPQDEIIVLEQRDYISFGGCGLPYFVGGMFDDTKRMIARTPEQAIASGIDLRILHQVIGLDAQNKQVKVTHPDPTSDTLITSEIRYDRLIICTGASPIVPDFGQYNREQAFTLTNLQDGIRLKAALAEDSNQRVCIIGGGFIGLEVLDMAHELGKSITLIEREASLMMRQFSPEMIAPVAQAIKDAGITLQLNTTVTAIGDNPDGSYHIESDRGDFDADLIIFALGFKPNTAAFELAKAANGALVVDQWGQTNHADIYAVGDCALAQHLMLEKPLYLPLATTANKQARMLADKLAGNPTYLNGFLGSYCVKVLDFELAATGLSAQMASEHQIPVAISTITDKNQTDYFPGQQPINIKLIYDPTDHRLLGGEIIGKKGAVSRINALAVAITAKMTTEQLGYLDFCYSPPFARTWDALNIAGNAAK